MSQKWNFKIDLLQPKEQDEYQKTNDETCNEYGIKMPAYMYQTIILCEQFL